MIILINILKGTPWWVFLVFTVLLWLGLQSLRPRIVRTWRIFLTPAIFIAWGLASLALALGASPLWLVDWLAGAAVAGALAIWTVRLPGPGADRERGLVQLPGSRLPIARNLLIFAAKYALAATAARHPEWRATLQPTDIAVSGLATGYFLGWSARFLLAYRRAPALAVVAVSGLASSDIATTPALNSATMTRVSRSSPP